MLLVPLVVTTLTLAPTGVESRLEVAAGGTFDYAKLGTPSSSDGADGFDGHAGAGLNVFVQRVRDDEAPPSLQPYLQRVGELHVDGGGGGFSTSPAPNSPLSARSGRSGYFDIAAWGYAQRFLYGYAHLGVSYASVTDSTPIGPAIPDRVSTTTLALPLEVAAGLRVADARLSFGWIVTPTRVDGADFRVPFWGQVSLFAFDVVHRRVALDAQVELLDGGAGASGGATVYLARRFGVGAVVRGSHAHPDHAAISDHAGAGLRFDAWTSPRVAVAVSYYFDWWQYSGSSGVLESAYVSLVDLTIRARPR